MEVHIVHYKKEYGNFENAQNYVDGICVISFFGEVINLQFYEYYVSLKFIYLIQYVLCTYFNTFKQKKSK